MHIKLLAFIIALLLTGCPLTSNPTKCKLTECLEYNNFKTEKDRKYAVAIYGDGYQNAMARNGVLQLPELEDYLQKIVNRLLTSVKTLKFRLKVIVTPDGYQFTSALPDGTVLVPLDLVHQAESEDEIAWVLGHEISHLLLGHFTQESSKQFMGKIMSKATAANNIMEYLNHITKGKKLFNESSKDSKKAAKYSKLFYLISRDYLLSAWSRELEIEADLFATDLLYKAGYDFQANTALGRISKASTKKNQLFEQFSKEFETAFNDKFSVNSTESDEYYDTGASGFTEFFSDLDGDEIANQFKKIGDYSKSLFTEEDSENKITKVATDIAIKITLKLLEQYTTVHPDVDKRMEILNEYMDKYYEEYESDETVIPLQQIKKNRKLKRVFDGYTVFKKMKTLMVKKKYKSAEKQMMKLINNYKEISRTSFARIEFFNLRNKMNQPKNAVRNLQYALNYKPVSLNVYLQLVEHYLTLNNLKKANKITKKAWEVYPENRELYPYILKIKMAEDNVAAANKIMRSCELKKPLIYEEMCKKPYKKAKKIHQKNKKVRSKGKKT